ncbi:colicin V synthesis protein [Pantoea sp. C2G6]|uniref:colicin V synthesis protein n=1 Tax=Pantoea sp. C2G6 TaxID=3243084 RepID=UPI003EDB203C
MRELNMIEVETVSGAGFMSSLTSSILGATFAGVAGCILGGGLGGDGGGILGIGTIGQMTGFFAGGIVGVIGGAIGGALVGWDSPDTVTSLVIQFVNSVNAGTFLPRKAAA